MADSFNRWKWLPNNKTTANIDDENIDALPMDDQERMRFAQDTRHRHRLVWWMMWVVSIWLLSVLLITCLNQVLGLGVKVEVQITLLATTTLNVLGLANIILNGLSNHPNRRKRK